RLQPQRLLQLRRRRFDVDAEPSAATATRVWLTLILILGLGGFLIELTERGFDLLLAVVTQDCQGHFAARRVAGDLIAKGIAVVDRRFIDGRDHISLMAAGALTGGSRAA